MRHGSLFSGIGGFDLAAEWMGWENMFHCEVNEFGRLVLKYYWPQAISYADITKTDFTIWRGIIDILTGGFPCQPYSLAGKRKGKEDERHLWPQMLRAIREIRPSFVVGENVGGIVSWSGGMVFNEVQADLEAEGYEVFPFILPSAGVNAPHRRDRVWFVAHSNHKGGSGEFREVQGPDGKVPQWHDHAEPCHTSLFGLTANSNVQGLQIRVRPGIGQVGNENGTCQGREPSRTYTKTDWLEFPTQSPFHCRNDGLSSRLSGITLPKHRDQSIKAYGNAIVPQVALEIFKAIQSTI